MGVETLDFGFATPKRHFLARNRIVWRILPQNLCTRLDCSLSQEPKNSPSHFIGAKSRMRRTETPKPIWIKFCMVVDIPDVVNYTNFGDYRLRGFWVAVGQISPSHWLSSSPLQRPCETVMQGKMVKSRSCHNFAVLSGFSTCHVEYTVYKTQYVLFVCYKAPSSEKSQYRRVYPSFLSFLAFWQF